MCVCAFTTEVLLCNSLIFLRWYTFISIFTNENIFSLLEFNKWLTYPLLHTDLKSLQSLILNPKLQNGTRPRDHVTLHMPEHFFIFQISGLVDTGSWICHEFC